jgi:hypothetical protein
MLMASQKPHRFAKSRAFGLPDEVTQYAADAVSWDKTA